MTIQTRGNLDGVWAHLKMVIIKSNDSCDVAVAYIKYYRQQVINNLWISYYIGICLPNCLVATNCYINCYINKLLLPIFRSGTFK